ncbi:tetratricopeptide repeat protein [Chryseobacterium sp. OV279]|uniref:tetratricopeptide repeat protein n=1 Tax=Chryseobacterium sp. OV279 TaxID=1500285 RepID=UPI000910BE2F|nr:tetratricopeptide repeat protein [Chryseobacterium sp. OV279]SHF07546.1 Tetratricopeptide repeat-containing protein [Chryseobacterium sp. OV279]
MRKYILAVILGFLLSGPVSACLNGDTKLLATGEMLFEDHEGYVPYGHDFGGEQRLKELLVRLEKGYKETKDINYLSDQGYVLILQGKYQKAVDLYKKIESMTPGRYSTASNMGTAYELLGNDKEALRWIEKSVEISSKSHLYSEWIHVNILKAKLKGEKYFTSQNLIKTDFGKEDIPKSTLNEENLEILREQLYYQLNERISFVQPKDKIVAQLLFDLGNISYLLADKDGARENFEKAKEYGFDDPILKIRTELYNPPIIDHTKKEVKKELKFQTKQVRRSQLIGIVISVFALMFSGLIVFIFRKKIFLMLK